MYGQPYATLRPLPDTRTFDDPLALLYIITNAWDGVRAILGHVVLCWGLDSAEIFLKSRTTREYCSDIIWTTYLSNFFLPGL